MPITSKKASPNTRRFSTNMVSCKQLLKEGKYTCVAMLPEKKNEGYTVLTPQPIVIKGRGSTVFDDVTINDATIDGKEFQFHRATDIKCVADFIGKTLHCK